VYFSHILFLLEDKVLLQSRKKGERRERRRNASGATLQYIEWRGKRG